MKCKSPYSVDSPATDHDTCMPTAIVVRHSPKPLATYSSRFDANKPTVPQARLCTCTRQNLYGLSTTWIRLVLTGRLSGRGIGKSTHTPEPSSYSSREQAARPRIQHEKCARSGWHALDWARHEGYDHCLLDANKSDSYHVMISTRQNQRRVCP